MGEIVDVDGEATGTHPILDQVRVSGAGGGAKNPGPKPGKQEDFLL